MAINFDQLREPFPRRDVKWVVTEAGLSKKDGNPFVKAVPYVSARAVQDRLDEVFTPAGWRCEFREIGNGMICRIGVWVNDQWVYKEDGAAPSGPKNIDAVKTVISGAFKRCAVQWGIGRLYYRVSGRHQWAEASLDFKYKYEAGWSYYQKKTDAGTIDIYWKPRDLPPEFYSDAPAGSVSSSRSSASSSKKPPAPAPIPRPEPARTEAISSSAAPEIDDDRTGLDSALMLLKRYSAQEMVTDSEKAQAKAAVNAPNDSREWSAKQVGDVYRELVRIVEARGDRDALLKTLNNRDVLSGEKYD